MKKMGDKFFSQKFQEVFEKNESFILKNYKQIFDEIIELINDSIDYNQIYFKHTEKERKKIWTRSTMHFFLASCLMPTSTGLVVELFSGNLIACFRSLRFVIEMFAKCYLADQECSPDLFFEKKMYQIQHTEKDRRVQEIEIIRRFSKITKNILIIDLWKKLSEETHSRKFVERVVDSVINCNNVPGYALSIPMPLVREELIDIKGINKYIVLFREVLNSTLSKNKENIFLDIL